MPIQIIDNFELTSAKPIDNRLVVGPNSFYTNKDDITNKYNGLRIWELPGSNIGGGLTNSTPSGVSYVWTGSAWISENTTGISGGGDSGRVPYFNSSNSIQSSNIYYNGTNIGIGISAETGSGSKLVVGGSIKSNGGYFIGDAWDSSTSTGLSNLNATNLSLGTVPIGRFPTSTPGWILTADSVAASYKNPSSITVGTSSVSNQVVVTSSSSSSTNYILFSNGTTGSKQVYTNTSLKFIPSSGKIQIGGSDRIHGDINILNGLYIGDNSTSAIITVPTGGAVIRGGLCVKSGSLTTDSNITMSSSDGGFLLSGGPSSNNISNDWGVHFASSGVAMNRSSSIRLYKGSSLNRNGISFFTSDNADPVERMRVNPDGSIFSNNFRLYGTYSVINPTLSSAFTDYTIGSTSSDGTTQRTILSSTSDRIFYLSRGGNQYNGAKFQTGFFQIVIKFGTDIVYFWETDARTSNSYGGGSEVNTPNACLIIPAGITCSVDFIRGGGLTASGTGITISGKINKFGLS